MFNKENKLLIPNNTLAKLNILIELRNSQTHNKVGAVEVISGLISEQLRRELKEIK